jgi:hypothetical protein
VADVMEQQLEGLDLTQRNYHDAARLGAPFKIVDGDVSPFRLKVAKLMEATLMIFVGVLRSGNLGQATFSSCPLIVA